MLRFWISVLRIHITAKTDKASCGLFCSLSRPCGTPISSHFVCGPYIEYMKELLRTNDIVLIAFTKHVEEVDIAVFELT